jgi:hypothetical protein
MTITVRDMLEATTRREARELARKLTSDARTLEGPVIWVTGNNYMPPIRSFPAAEKIWELDDPDLWELFCETVEDELSRAAVVMEAPDYDNALYVVDLNRWEHTETPNPDFNEDDINSEWKKANG